MLKLFSQLAILIIIGVGVFVFKSEFRPFWVGYDNVMVIEDKPISIMLPESVENSEKRSFSDVTCSGITDMIELDRELTSFDKFDMRIFEGVKGQSGYLEFAEKANIQTLDFDRSIISRKTKYDFADLNNNGCADLVLSEFLFGFFDDSIRLTIGMNKGNNKFEFYKDYVSNPKNLLSQRFITSVINLIKTKGRSSTQIKKYLQIDWGDFDGNGTEDFALMWKNFWDLDVDIIYTKENDLGKMEIAEAKSFSIDNFMFLRDIAGIDSEDYNGDGKADIAIQFNPWYSNEIVVSMALNNGNGFTPYQDIRLELPDNYDNVTIISASKKDSFDVNFDGIADIVRIGEEDGKPVMVAYLIKP